MRAAGVAEAEAEEEACYEGSRRQRRCHEAIAACTEQRRAYFKRCRPREEAMKGGRGSEGDEDGGGAS